MHQESSRVEQVVVPSGPSGMDVEGEVSELEVNEEEDGGDGIVAKGGFLSTMVMRRCFVLLPPSSISDPFYDFLNFRPASDYRP